MFDMGFTELMLIGIVGLIVIGPERLPGVARTAGKYVGRLKRFMTSVKADVEQELRADELRQILSQQQKELDSLKDTINEAGMDVERQANLNAALNDKTGTLETPDPSDPVEQTPTPADPVASEPPASSDSVAPEEPVSKTSS